MAILASLPSTTYNPRTLNQGFSVPQGSTALKITLTRQAWPEGRVGSCRITWSNGDFADVTLNGGAMIGRDGNEILQSFLSMSIPPGVSSGTASVVVLQATTTAITVEAL